MLFVGIDPGFSGALAAYDADARRLVAVLDMPCVQVVRGGKKKPEINPHAVAEFIRTHNAGEAFIEQVQARPGQNVSAMFRFGEGYGLVQGVCAVMNLPLTKVAPQTWIKALSVPATPKQDRKSENDRKDASRARAMELFPEHAKLFARKADDGRAEASLIALFGARLSGGEK